MLTFVKSSNHIFILAHQAKSSVIHATAAHRGLRRRVSIHNRMLGNLWVRELLLTRHPSGYTSFSTSGSTVVQQIGQTQPYITVSSTSNLAPGQSGGTFSPEDMWLALVIVG
jgi:hypothetical protein